MRPDLPTLGTTPWPTTASPPSTPAPTARQGQRLLGLHGRVETVIAEKRALAAVLLPKEWTTSTDVSVFLPVGAAAAEREAVRALLEAIDGVAEVSWESPEQAYRRLPEKLRRDGRDPAKVTPLFTPGSVPGAFHVTLDGPARVREFHPALCGSRRTGDCAGGLVVLEHPRKQG